MKIYHFYKKIKENTKEKHNSYEFLAAFHLNNAFGKFRKAFRRV